MADETKQTQDNQDTDDEQRDGDESDRTERRDGDKGGDEDKPGAALLKALNEEREARRKAEADLRKREKADRDAETARAIKAGEWEAVAKGKDGEIAERDARIAELEAEIASSRLETIRERVAAKHKLPPALAARLQGADEATLEADARELAKLVVVKAPNTEAGAGSNGASNATKVEQVKDELRKSGRYASVG